MEYGGVGYNFQIENYMYSTASSHINSKVKARAEAETGTDFAKDESFSFEIEAEREYVHRLKVQREKIEALYSKYDTLLEEMRKKDEKIKQQERRIGQLSSKCKQLSLLMPELDILRKQNVQLHTDNETMRNNLLGVEESYYAALSDYKSKSTLNQKEKEKVQEFNEQLVSKMRLLQQKMEEKHFTFEKDRKTWSEKLDECQKQVQTLRAKHISDMAIVNNQILSRNQQIDILQKQNQKLREALVQWEQSSLNLLQENEFKVQKVHADYKIKIKAIKQEIEQQLYNNELLTGKINVLSLQIEKLNQDNIALRESMTDQKRRSEEAVYEARLLFSQEKSILREHAMQLESKLAKLEKQLGDSIRRERELAATLRRLEEGEQVKKSLREVERRELEKINRLLLLEK